ncbi:MAG: hypothetical protein LBR16_06385 [Treponema sp.]|nr:hypothetical protein [Treponema sp.]
MKRKNALTGGKDRPFAARRAALSVVLAASLAMLSAAACRVETPEATPDARFVTQQNEPNCGGYTTVYYQWLKQGKYTAGDATTERAFIGTVYDQITFGVYDNNGHTGDGYAHTFGAVFPGIENGANPARMIKYLQSVGLDGGVFYLEPAKNDQQNYPINYAFHQIFNFTKGYEASLLTEIGGEAARVRDAVIPDLAPYQYAIGIYVVFDNVTKLGQGELSGLHYVLFHHNGDRLVYYNPWDGYPKPAYYEQLLSNGEPIVSEGGRILVPTSSGILLP